MVTLPWFLNPTPIHYVSNFLLSKLCQPNQEALRRINEMDGLVVTKSNLTKIKSTLLHYWTLMLSTISATNTRLS